METVKKETKKAARARIIQEKIDAKKAAYLARYKMVTESVIGLALMPLKSDALIRAEKDAKEAVAQRTADLEAANWNLDTLAPYPDSRKVSGIVYRSMLSNRRKYECITQWANIGSKRIDEPTIVKIDDESVVRFIANSIEFAGLQYDEFVFKMYGKTKKSNPTAAHIEGNHIWGWSHLFVTLADGTVQKWRTQQIANYSVYGKYFPQWPSRIVK